MTDTDSRFRGNDSGGGQPHDFMSDCVTSVINQTDSVCKIFLLPQVRLTGAEPGMIVSAFPLFLKTDRDNLGNPFFLRRDPF